jgi:hypothetical protein
MVLLHLDEIHFEVEAGATLVQHQRLPLLEHEQLLQELQ